jgi:hypothetical protein
MIQPALTAPPTGLPAFRIARKIDPTRTTEGATGSIGLSEHRSAGDDATSGATAAFDLAAKGQSTGPISSFARRFPDGGDYRILTWEERGVAQHVGGSRTGGGPGELWSVPVSPSSDPSQELLGRAARLR